MQCNNKLSNSFSQKNFRLTANIKIVRNSENKEIWSRQKLAPIHLASSSSDRTIKIWKNIGCHWKCVKTLVGHTSYVTYATALPSGEIVSASVDSTIKIWDYKKESNNCIKTIQANQSWIESLTLIKDKTLIVSCSDEAIKIWDYQGYCVRILQGHENDVKMCLELFTGELCSCSWDGCIKLWNMDNGKCIRTINTLTMRRRTSQKSKQTTFGIYCIFTWHNQIDLLAGCDDSSILCVDLKLGNVKKILKGHSECVMSIMGLTLSQFISGGGDKTIKIWDFEMGVCLKTVTNAHESWINSLIVLSNGQVLSCSNDKTIRIWNFALSKIKCVQTLRGHSSGVSCLSSF